jgi:hypothetical protein
MENLEDVVRSNLDLLQIVADRLIIDDTGMLPWDEALLIANEREVLEILHRLKAQEYIFLCGQHACKKIIDSDVLKRFIENEYFSNSVYAEVVLKALQRLTPETCILHPVGISYFTRSTLERITTFKDYAGAPLKSGYFINVHVGKESNRELKLNPAEYRTDQIKPCRYKMMALQVALPNHSNMLIIDNDMKTIEHFEPNGAYFTSNPKLNKRVESDFKKLGKLLFPGYTYIPRSETCIKLPLFIGRGPQGLVHFSQEWKNNTCVIWSLWYAYLRMTQPGLSREEVLHTAYTYLTGKNYDELEHFITKLVSNLTATLQIRQEPFEYRVQGRSIFKNIDIPEFDFLPSDFDMDTFIRGLDTTPPNHQ